MFTFLTWISWASPIERLHLSVSKEIFSFFWHLKPKEHLFLRVRLTRRTLREQMSRPEWQAAECAAESGECLWYHYAISRTIKTLRIHTIRPGGQSTFIQTFIAKIGPRTLRYPVRWELIWIPKFGFLACLVFSLFRDSQFKRHLARVPSGRFQHEPTTIGGPVVYGELCNAKRPDFRLKLLVDSPRKSATGRS